MRGHHTVNGPLTFHRIDVDSYQHAVGDSKPPTAYEVYDGDRFLGKVRSRSRESWRQLPSGVRYGFRGYARNWEAINTEGRSVGNYFYQRGEAAEQLRKDTAP